MDKRLYEAVELFEEVMIYGTSRILKSVDGDVWRDFSREQVQMMKLIEKEEGMTSNRLAELQGVHKSAVSNRLKKLLDKEVVEMIPDENDQRTKLIMLTERGKQVVEKTNEMVFQYIERIFSEHIEEEELEQFISMFRKIKSILKVDGE
ncbi:MarR family transcriptional regulator [Halalkalibacillus sediminis]|uniref:MarR family transcriptional regulator n=1 Tax=Halalkalibacillus sediminis TaxID=2018042 RepID=A0A2I0QSJ7_9BACI|nr:MarR family transcriptional regulator [Halalkalibacillus sediminis]PKR77080.1 MarR family transcriptional regulator [Halalkalibacillus sediminis]